MVEYEIQDLMQVSDMVDHFVSILIPAYNESDNLALVLEDITHFMYKLAPHYEVIVIDDGSTDNTAEIANIYAVKIIRHTVNQGKGVALQTAIKAARGDIIITMDADGSHQAKDLNKFIQLLVKNEELDAVIGSRFLKPNGRKSTTKFNILGNRIFNVLISLFTGKKVTDSQSGFRAFRKDAAQEIDLESRGFDVETELTIKSLRKGMVVEIPIDNKERSMGQSRLKPIKDGLKILKSILKFV